MRADFFWSAVWGTCFVGGVLLGCTGATTTTVTRPSQSPKLRGGEAASVRSPAKQSASPSQLAESPVERKELTAAGTLKKIEEESTSHEQKQELEQHDTVNKLPTMHRTLGSLSERGDFNVDLVEGNVDRDHRSQVEKRVRGGYLGGLGASKTAQHIHALNGGLWGPNEEEEKEISEELARLDEDNTNRWEWTLPLSGEGRGDAEEHPDDGVLGAATHLHSLAVFSYGFEDDDGMSYDF